MRLKGKFYKSIARPTMLYGSEYWVMNKIFLQRMSVAEMRLFRWMSEVTREDRIRNEYIRRSIEVAANMDKIRENRLKSSVML